MAQIRIRRVTPSDITAREQLKEIFGDPEPGYIGFLIRNKLFDQIGLRTFSERGGWRPEEVSGFIAESKGKIVGILLYDLGKIFSFVRGKRDVDYDFGRNVVGNPEAPEILRMPITPLESSLSRKWREKGEEFIRDTDILFNEGLIAEEERQDFHMFQILEKRLREKGWLGLKHEMLDESKRVVVEAFLGARRFFQEVVKLEDEVDHDYERRFNIPHTSSGEILILGVHPSYRRRGIASKLMDEATRGFKESQAVFVVVILEKENIAAQRLYEKFGFKLLYEYEDNGTEKIYMINPLYETR